MARIVAKYAFYPPRPTYSVVACEDGSSYRLQLDLNALPYISNVSEPSELLAFYTTTQRQSRIVCLYVPSDGGCLSPVSSPRRATAWASSTEAPYTVLFSHGNAVDLGATADFLQEFARRFGVNILSYDYSGYGLSTGDLLESNVYADAEAVMTELRERFNVPLERTILYGQSLGTAPTVELATKYKVAGVVLHSPLMSGLRVVWPNLKTSFCFDAFTNIEKIPKIRSPTLIIHGTADDVIGVNHGRELYSRLPNPLEPLWVGGAGHNDITEFPAYFDRLGRFFQQDLKENLPLDELPSNNISSCSSSKSK
ncbi:Alpha/beta hydrolase domain-containing protein 17B [Clonorchis sinensis]|uniref:Abhydrolase domain-containing protein FAM108B1 n=2 Tax=Clonorchis sinensis TaxID=79923 RepID=H2KS05_CLOSI|nr:Alpha/beta hydrolase domain-containing protein 17B [Clonorchis sinensis]GAA28130.1 abhydrolase domain-containing protein FAM108B1 [Clonorchis sinensis]